MSICRHYNQESLEGVTEIASERFIKRIIKLGNDSAGDNALHIVAGIDRNYARPMGVLMTSVLLHNEDVAFHIFADAIDDADVERIRRTAEKYGAFCSWYVIDADKFFALPTTRNWTTATYFRFIAGEYFYKKIPRFIYLDSDMLCIGNLHPVFETTMGEKSVAAVIDPGLPSGRLKRIGHTGDGYFNAGFLLIDTARWREDKIFARSMELLHKNPERYEALDQDVLNLTYSNRVLWLNKRYNQENNVMDEYPEETVIIHYTSTPKPWLGWYFCGGINLWHEVSFRSEWRDVPLISEPDTARETRLMSRASFQRGEKWEGLMWYVKYLMKKVQAQT